MFGLTPAERDLGAAGGFTTSLREDGQSKTPVTYLDFTVDANPLFSSLAELTPGPFDFVGVIQDAWPIETVAAIQRLLGEASGDLPDGRVSLYVCPECGDLGCGAVTARLLLDAEAVTWQAIGCQTDYDESASALGEDGVFPDISFNRDSYEQVLRQERARVARAIDTFEYPYQHDRRLRRERRARAIRRLFPHR
ncbi:hypothetical protein GCM10028802_28100 [Terrabacter terrigena]